jgi:hypothetical protein
MTLLKEQGFVDDTVLWSAYCDECLMGINDENGTIQYRSADECRAALEAADWAVGERVLCPKCRIRTIEIDPM